MYDSFARITLFATIYLVYVTRVTSENSDVNTQQGRVRGIGQDVLIAGGNETKTIYKFLGVPYAQKPIGNLRFKPPKALSRRRSSDYDATSFRPVCMQTEHYFDSVRGAWPEFDPKTDMSEDCLYLNIYTPSTTGATKYPVIFHIHGGSYIDGTPIRDISPGEYLPTRDVVLVTIQYRLGTFGFFTTGDSEAPGNVGLLDQVEALKWVRDNIEGFGGNKNSVTLLGESSGGSSVGLHYLSPLSNGLFHRGIAVSGVDLSPFAYKPKSIVLQTSMDLVTNVNCTKASSQQVIQCLKSLSSTTLLNNSKYWLMQPFVDQHFLPDKPKTLREEGRFHKVPLMSGFVSHDGSFILQFKKINEYYTEGFKKYLERFLRESFNSTKEEAPTAYKALEFQFTPWGFLKNPMEHRRKLVEMLSDFYVAAPTVAVLKYHSDHGAPAYMFEFAHRSQHHPKPKWMGVVHEDTTAYKFGLPLLNAETNLKFDENDQRVSDMLVTMFTNFAKYGNPTPTPVDGKNWLRFTSYRTPYMKIEGRLFNALRYHPLRMAFWNNYFPTLIPDKEDSVTGDDQAVVDDNIANVVQFW